LRYMRSRWINKKPKFNFYKAKSLDIPNQYFGLLKQGNVVVLPDGREILPEQVLSGPDHPLSFAYCSDTCYNEALVEHIRHTSLLYHEATFLHDMKDRANATAHSTALEAGQIAGQAEVGQLVLGHFSARYNDLQPLLDEARSVFPNTHLAKEGHTFKVKA
jgi:ribonuclease Z